MSVVQDKLQVPKKELEEVHTTAAAALAPERAVHMMCLSVTSTPVQPVNLMDYPPANHYLSAPRRH